MDNMTLIENAFEKRHQLSPQTADNGLREALKEIFLQLDAGKIRVAEKINDEWVTHQWIKKAILLSFKVHDNELMASECTNYYDKIPLKYAQTTEQMFKESRVRVVPPAHVRYGAYVGANTILMPSFVNVGAFVDEGVMVDTWVTVGSCAQIGKHVHLSGGVGIGGVLEPLQANPTIIEDNVFVGARSEIVEGVIVKKNAVISMGVFIGQSTKIYNRETGEISYGVVPEGAVVVPGSLPAKDGSHSLYCAVIVKQVDETTRNKTAINELLR